MNPLYFWTAVTLLAVFVTLSLVNLAVIWRRCNINEAELRRVRKLRGSP